MIELRTIVALVIGCTMVACGLPLETMPSTTERRQEYPLPAPTVDMTFRGQGLPLKIIRSYMQEPDFKGPLGRRWTHNYLMYVEEKINGYAKVFNSNGYASYFAPDGSGGFVTPPFDYRTLERMDSGGFRLETPTGEEFVFDRQGVLISIADSSDSHIGLEYGPNRRLEAILGRGSQRATIHYDDRGRIKQIADELGRTVGYIYDENGNLTDVTTAAGFTTRYEYDAGHQLVGMIGPGGRRTALYAGSNLAAGNH